MKYYEKNEILDGIPFYKYMLFFDDNRLDFKRQDGFYVVKNNSIYVYLNDSPHNDLYTLKKLKSLNEGARNVTENNGIFFYTYYISLSSESETEIRDLLLEKLSDYIDSKSKLYQKAAGGLDVLISKL